MNWFQLYAEFASDPKVQSMSEPMQRRLVMLFCLQANGDVEKLDDDELAMAMRITAKELEKTREVFEKKGFIASGSWQPRNWEKRQTSPDPKAAERMRRYRARLQDEDRNVTRNGHATLPAMQPITFSRAGAIAGASPSPSVSVSVFEPENRESPLPPFVETDANPIAKDVLDKAARRWGSSGGDAVVGEFLREYPVEWVQNICERAWLKWGRQFKPQWMAGGLNGMRVEGGPTETVQQAAAPRPRFREATTLTPEQRQARAAARPRDERDFDPDEEA